MILFYYKEILIYVLMSKQYTCDLCKDNFNTKTDLMTHQKKFCEQSESNSKSLINDKKTSQLNLINIFKNCLNILRDNEGLTGEKALRTLSYLIILKLLEPRFEDEIDIDTYDYDFSYLEDEIIEHHRTRLLFISRFSNLIKENEENIPNLMRYLWKDILSVHPTTKNIFLPGKGFDIEHSSTYKKMFEKLNSPVFKKTDYDVLGNAYEEVIQDIMTGKVLGQFFTQPLVKKIMVKLIDPQIYPDGTIDTCADPTMGTGGFLITYLQYILQQAKTKGIEPDWEFIKNEGIYGKELEPDTYQLAVSNMLISSGHMFEKLDRGDSIRQPIERQFDNILANPPFGIKGLKYDDFNSPLKSEYVPIKSDNAVSLFIQAIIHMLKINGKCAVVLPDGQDLFSKTNITLVSIREYLMKTCDLKEIIYLPSGIFTYTTIKTCIFYFVKKMNGSDVLETQMKISKTQKITGRDYKFSKVLQTKSVKFYEYNVDNDTKTLLVDVPINKIVSNSYSLNYAEYIKDDIEESYGEGIDVKTLGEICDIDKKIIKHQTEYGKSIGKYKFHTGGVRTDLYVDEYDIEELYIIQNRTNGSGRCNLFLDKQFSLAKQTMVYKSKNNNENTTKYIYYYLYSNISILEKGYVGANHKNISHEYLQNIKIPIPSLKKQQEIVKYLDFIYEKAIKTSNEKIVELKQLNEYCLSNQKIFGENVVKELGEISIINPENMKSDQYTEINYIDIASVKGGQILELQKLKNDFPSRAKRIVKKGDILYSSVRPNLKGYVYISDDIQNGIASTGFADIRVKESNTILPKYLYYIMTSNYITDDLISKAKGAQYPAVSFDDFEALKIPIPSLKKQQEIVEYCEYNDTLIKQLEKEIENNKKLAHEVINSIIKVKVDEEQMIIDDILKTNKSIRIVNTVDNINNIDGNEKSINTKKKITKKVK